MQQDMHDSYMKRLCFVCGEAVPAKEGIAHLGYRFLYHRTCEAAVKAEERIYDRSTRGRWRSPAQVRARLRAARATRQGS